MITDMELVLAAVAVVAAVVVALTAGYLVGARTTRQMRRQLAERDQGDDLEDVMRAVTHRYRGRAR